MLIVLFSIAIPLIGFSIFSTPVFAVQDNSTVLEQAQKALEANQNQASSTGIDSSQEASKIIKGTSMSTYENNDYGIRIKFPNNWKPSEINLPQHGIVLFYAPPLGTAFSYIKAPFRVIIMLPISVPANLET